MYQQEKIKPYSPTADKGAQVEQMFDHIAPTYDTLNHRLSWNIDRLWRKKAIALLHHVAHQQVLDIATGTGDFALLAAKKLPQSHITGIDISEGMLQVGRQKAHAQGLADRVEFRKDDCMKLNLPENQFDVVTAAFGIRNFQDLDKGLKEMHRVMKPGGTLCILELTSPVSFPMRQLFHLYAHTFLPLYGRLVSKDRQAYRYLTATIEAFPQGEQMMHILQKAGFQAPTFKRLTFGICTLYTAKKNTQDI